MKLKGLAIELCEMKTSDTLDAYRLHLKLQTTLSFYSSQTSSLGFCMTLGLGGVSKREVNSERCRHELPSTILDQTASMAKKLANNLEMHLVPQGFSLRGLSEPLHV